MDGGDDALFAVAEDEVAELAHDLGDKILFGQIAELVAALKFKEGGTIEAELGHGGDLRRAEVLAKEHTEHRRHLRIVKHRIAKAHTGVSASGVDEKPLGFALLAVLASFTAEDEEDRLL